jgi:hypothetical protein
MKLGISIKINVSDIEKSRLFKGEKGVYLDLTTFIDLDNQDQYGNNGFISQSVTKEERDNKVQTTILGNCKVFYKKDEQQPAQQQQQYQQSPQQASQSFQQPPPQQQQAPQDDFDGIPFANPYKNMEYVI